MITTTNGGSVPRIALRSVEYSHRRLIEYSGLNSRVLDDLFEIVWHENLSLDNSAIRINVILPVEIRNECKKIDERRRKPNQKQSDIEATISKWANDPQGSSRIPSFSGSAFTCVMSQYCSTEAAM